MCDNTRVETNIETKRVENISMYCLISVLMSFNQKATFSHWRRGVSPVYICFEFIWGVLGWFKWGCLSK